ncbi:hypothetical protein BJX63DRAFT_438605 [Aspergillus granulosus]|uniref:Uncharacterized protein n=1 Tax=Aspergillus granulosus TaxID=176169 RepID=A0ABR4GRF9_9EURO
MAFIAAFIAVVTGLVGFPLAKLVAIISSAVSSLLIIGASVTVTIMYQLLTRGINTTLEQAGISASLGPRVLAASWLGMAFSGGMKGEMLEQFRPYINSTSVISPNIRDLLQQKQLPYWET